MPWMKNSMFWEWGVSASFFSYSIDYIMCAVTSVDCDNTATINVQTRDVGPSCFK